MDPLALIEDYLSDQENGMKTLITGFLNQVMLAEALQQAGAAQYERTDARKAHRNGYKDRSLKTRYGENTGRQSSGNPSSASSRSRRRSLGAMPGWRKLW